ncbi:PAAR domain-containing protein [Variovorax boronicumulans]|uniref:PAAR domain-containing protein n=1 Tax=Variovorax boronicumulans TaxID=436515 RepID=UPI001C582F25
MKDANNRRAIRLGDPTDHGGEVKTALTSILVRGLPVAAEGCLVTCPRCGGDFRILPSASPSPRRHLGQTIAFEDDLTECGARLLSTLPG